MLFWRLTLLVLVNLFIQIPLPVAAIGDPGPAAEPQSIDHLRVQVVSALKARVQSLQNLELTSTTKTRRHKFIEGQVGKAVNAGTMAEFVMRRLNEGYYLEAKLYSLDRISTPDIVSKSNFNEVEGVSRSLMLENGGSASLFARIDSQKDDTIQLNRAAFFLAETVNVNNLTFYGNVLNEGAPLVISPAGGNGDVLVSAPYDGNTDALKGLKGTVAFVCNASNGMAPIRHKIAYRGVVSGKEIWREETVSMSDLRQIEGVWIPFMYDTVITSSSLGEGECIVESSSVASVKLGEVSKESMALEFPPETLVSDVINGVTYRVGANGDPAERPIPFFSKQDIAVQAATDRSKFLSFSTLLWINLGLICSAFLFITIWRIRRRLT